MRRLYSAVLGNGRRPIGPIRRIGRIVLAALLLATSALADVQRTVTPGAAGPNRLAVDVPLLSRAAADLRDLRLYDAQQREVGYLLVPPADTAPQWLPGRLLPVAATKKSSGFELDLGRTESVDRLRFDGIAAPFLKRVRIEGSGDRTRWTILADATVFDLPDDRLRLLEVPFPADRFRYLRATWDDRSSAPVQTGAASARKHDRAAPPEPLRASVPFRQRASEPGKSRYRITLPGPHLPLEAIELRVANGNVFRHATVTEPRLGNGEVVPAILGESTLRRAERWGAVAEDMAVRIERPSERELDLVVDDGNNPPLAITAVLARFAPQPWIYFEAASSAPLTARYGNARLNAPEYDLEASRRYLQDAAPAEAEWETVTQEVAASTPEAGTAAALQGAPVDRSAFRVTRPIPAVPAGLSVLLLDADVHARSRDLADVRIVTAGDTQVPYLVEKRDEPLVLTLKPQRVDAPRGTSVYRLDIPYKTLPMDSYVVLKTSARVFEREVVMRSAANDRRGRMPSELHRTTWRAADPELLPPALSLHTPLTLDEPLEIVIQEGDNAPLPITSAQLLLPSAALRFHHPGTPLTLLYGNQEAQPPRYDLALLAPRLFGQPARELTLPPVTAPTADTPDHRQRNLFWIAMVVVAVALLLLLARLLVPKAEAAREEQP